EPDLSMELMGQLRVHFSALEADFFKEVRSGHDEQQVRFKYADAAAAEIVPQLEDWTDHLSGRSTVWPCPGAADFSTNGWTCNAWLSACCRASIPTSQRPKSWAAKGCAQHYPYGVSGWPFASANADGRRVYPG
ncbi:unnamed protein product, partial [Durusdinium trenchii]